MLFEQSNRWLFVMVCLAVMTVLSCAGYNSLSPKVQPEETPTDCLALGNKYFLGEGVERDYTQAAEYFQKAADEQNSPEAWFMLGRMHLEGLGFEQDIKEGARDYAKAANLGHDEARYQLAALFFSSRAYDEAFDWAAPAAKNNHAKAQFLVGMLFLEVGDNDLALEWLARSAIKGHAPAAGIIASLGPSPQSLPDPSAPIREEMLVNPFK
ncbi:Sel1 repeat-containing protein [Desulfatibacillum alkenivorans DSM 16219]|jgi:TPR repeat protein|uniref:Sel1 repeat-containing protein n=1 Tax=Desulfatibacillum alkenivorans DSM 16219 TaxID=1121393 RepID=A0A1M6YY09_9BACT|nr:tetratricopeptide repeat protein [Desulfatibacillum alkenivorans]SHL22962.1 Sel1 repeat-containing protein [Desulfatibacillum alkenivorans DSM 16219]